VDYQIIATLGPRSRDEATWQEMLSAGVSGFRLNTSHLSLDELSGWLERLEPFIARQNKPPALTLDLQGSKWRLGSFEPFSLRQGQRIVLVLAAEASQVGVLPVPHADFFQAADASGDEVAVDDARVLLKVEDIGTERLTARVIQGGRVRSHKGITYRFSEFRQEQPGPKDQKILAMTRGTSGIHYAISYVRDAKEMARYRAVCGKQAYLTAKLERQPALDDWSSIAELADELWLCRGDLGAELGMRKMAEEAARVTHLVRSAPKPVLLAGQVLEHMTRHATPTRSEVCYLHDALAAGYAGVVLSDETAVGRQPVQTCRAAALFLNCHDTGRA
jgi:pyruvate kinase